MVYEKYTGIVILYEYIIRNSVILSHAAEPGSMIINFARGELLLDHIGVELHQGGVAILPETRDNIARVARVRASSLADRRRRRRAARRVAHVARGRRGRRCRSG